MGFAALSRFIIADLSEDMLVATGHYSDVHTKLGRHLQHEYDAWVGIRMPSEPPGFVARARLTVNAV